MSSSALARKICVLAGSAVAALLVAAGAAPAGQAATFYLTPKRKPGRLGPLPTYGCTVAPPLANTNQFHQTSWSGGTQCNISLRQQGTTVLYIWGSSNAYAFGTSYDNVNSAEMSTGGPISTINNTWGLNNNVLLFSPSGYTTTPGGGCYWYDGAHTQVKCTATTGPFTG